MQNLNAWTAGVYVFLYNTITTVTVVEYYHTIWESVKWGNSLYLTGYESIIPIFEVQEWTELLSYSGCYIFGWSITLYYIDTDEIPGFLLLIKNHTFTAHSEDTIFIFHVWGYWCGHGYQHNNCPITIELLAQARGWLIWNFIHKMASRCKDSRVIEFFSSLLEFWLFQTENISIIFFISPLLLYIRVS